MNDYYDTDKWGYPKKRKCKEHWGDFEPWQFWKDGFLWIRCDSDFEEQDVVAFRDDVPIDYDEGARSYLKGKRLIIARVCNIEKNRMIYLEVIQSDGKSPYLREDLISRQKRYMVRYGVYRWPRKDIPGDGDKGTQKGNLSLDKKKKRPEKKRKSDLDYKMHINTQRSRFVDIYPSLRTDFTKAAKRLRKPAPQHRKNNNNFQP